MERVDDATCLPQPRLCPVDQIPGAIPGMHLAVAVTAVDVALGDLNGPWGAEPGDVPLEIQVGGEDLNAAIGAVRDVFVPAPGPDALRGGHLPVTAPPGRPA